VTRSSFARRVWRTALLDADTYEEVEADRGSLAQATLVVALASAATCAGVYLSSRSGAELGPLPLPWLLAIAALEPFVTWLAGSAFAFMVGASFFRGPDTESDYLEVLRTSGFAFSPLWLGVLGWIEPALVAMVLAVLCRLWMWVACVVAVRQALDFTTARSIGTFGAAAALLWTVLWGLSVMPLPF